MSFVRVDRNGRYTVDPLYQWDKNQALEISGLTVPNTPEIHFVNRSMAEAFVRQGTKDKLGIITVDIPNVILEKPLPIDVYICAYEGDLFRTLYKLQIPVKERTKPSDYIYETEDEVLSFNALNNRLTDSIANMQTLVNDTVESINKKCDDTLTELNLKSDNALATLNKKCDDTLAQLDTNNDESLAELNRITQDAVQNVNAYADTTRIALTNAFDERVANLKAEVVGDDVVSLEGKLTNMIQVKSNISIATSAWSNKSYKITFDKIVDGSIVDVYYNSASKEAIADAEPTYTVGVGYLTITVNTVPTSAIVIDTIKVVNDV